MDDRGRRGKSSFFFLGNLMGGILVGRKGKILNPGKKTSPTQMMPESWFRWLLGVAVLFW